MADCKELPKYTDIAKMDVYHNDDDNDEKNDDDDDFPIETKFRIYADLHDLLSDEHSSPEAQSEVLIPRFASHSENMFTITEVVSNIVTKPAEEFNLVDYIVKSFIELKNLYYDLTLILPNDPNDTVKNFGLDEFDLLMDKLVNQYRAWQSYYGKKNNEPAGLLNEIENCWYSLANKVRSFFFSYLPINEMDLLFNKETFIQLTTLTQRFRIILIYYHSDSNLSF